MDTLLQEKTNVGVVKVVSSRLSRTIDGGIQYIHEVENLESFKGEKSQIYIVTRDVSLEVGWRYLFFWSDSLNGKIEVDSTRSDLISFLEDISVFSSKEYMEYRSYFGVNELNNLKVSGGKQILIDKEAIFDHQFDMVEWRFFRSYLVKTLNYDE